MVLNKKNSIILLGALSCLVFNLSYANNKTPQANCTLTDEVSGGSVGGAAKDVFEKKTPAIYLICSFDNVSKGQTLKTAWIAADTNNVAPANDKIVEKSVQVPENLASNQTYYTHFTLSPPMLGLPTGSYRVELYANDQLLQSTNFIVK